MWRRALIPAVWLCAAVGFAFAGCGKSPQQSPSARGPESSGEGGEETPAGAGGGGGTGGTRGGESGSTGRGGEPTGGASSGGGSGTSTAGGHSGTGGTRGGTGGASGQGAEGGADSPGGGGAGGGPADPVICDRLGEIVAGRRADPVALTFERNYYADCRLAALSQLYLAIGRRTEFLNALRSMTLDLWGCRDMPATTFSLVYSPVPLSSAEVHALIEHYLNASRLEAQLSPSEAAFVERELTRLAAPLVDSSLADFSRSRCPDAGTGGDGGSAGAPGGGAAGSPGGG